MRRQKRKNAVRLQKMTRDRLGIQQLTLNITTTLHTKIIIDNRSLPRPPRRFIQESPIANEPHVLVGDATPCAHRRHAARGVEVIIMKRIARIIFLSNEIDVQRGYSAGRLTTMASWVLRAITTSAGVVGSGFSSRCGR